MSSNPLLPSRTHTHIISNTRNWNFNGTGAPTKNDDINSGYEIGSEWFIPGSDVWICLQNTANNAVWQKLCNCSDATLWNVKGSARLGLASPQVGKFNVIRLTGAVGGRIFAAVIVQQGTVAPYVGGAVFILDVTAPDAPFFVNPATPGFFVTITSNPQSLWLHGTNVYVTTNTGTYYVISFSNPALGITSLGTFPIVSGQQWATVVEPFGVTLRGYTTSSGGVRSLTVLDVTNPASITLVNHSGNTVPPQTFVATALAVVGNYAYVGNFSAQTLVVFDISAVSVVNAPVLVTSLALTFSPNMATAHSNGAVIYVTQYNGSRLAVVDISTPATPVLTTVLTLNVAGVASQIRPIESPSSRRLYVGGANALIDVYDISNPLAPSLITTFDSGFNGTTQTLQLDVDDATQNIYLPVRAAGNTDNLTSPNQALVLTPIVDAHLNTSLVAASYYNRNGQLVGGVQPFAAAGVTTAFSSTGISSSAIAYGVASPSLQITGPGGVFTGSGTLIRGTAPNTTFPIKMAGWPMAREVTLTNLWVTLHVSSTTLAGGNLRVAAFISVDNGATYNINTSLLVEFTPADLGGTLTITSALDPGTVVLQTGTIVALVPTIVGTLGTTTGACTFDISAGISYF